MQPDECSHSLFNLNLLCHSMQAALGDRSKDSSEIKRVTRDLSDTFTKIVRQLRPEIVMEIGAHEAGFSQRMKRTLPDSRIIAFEANPDVFNRHVGRCTELGVEYLNLCAADQKGTLTLRAPRGKQSADRNTMGSILTLGGASDFIVHEVEAATVDGFLGDGAQRSNAMWIDVEGAAGVVLDGSRETLSSCVALYAEVESTSRWEKQKLDNEIFANLQQYGLVPVLRDFQRAWQYNVLFLNKKVLSNPHVQRLCRLFIQSIGSTKTD